MKVINLSWLGVIALFTVAFFACQKDAKSPELTSAGKPTPANALAAPTITCGTSTLHSITLNVKAGANGAPAGFSIQWMTAADYAANGNAWYTSDDPRLCKASFSGVPGCSSWNLGVGGTTTVEIGNLSENCGTSFSCNGDLPCGTAYVFRAFAHNVPGGLNKSDFTSNLTCSTDPCENGDCTSETAYGGGNSVNVGTAGAWFYTYDAGSGTQTLWAGQTMNAGTVTYNAGTGTFTIALNPGWQLNPNTSEPVKIQGYTTLPTTRPPSGQFTTYKGTSLTPSVASFPYYIIHVDVQHCTE